MSIQRFSSIMRAHTFVTLAEVIIVSSLLAIGREAAAFTATQLPAVTEADTRNKEIARDVKRIRDVNEIISQKFNDGLDELNKRMPVRSTSGIELDVTDVFLPFLPNRPKIDNVIDDLESIGLRPQREESGSSAYFTYFIVPYDRLVTNGRTSFRSGDKLIITYITSGPGINAEVTRLKVNLLNDRGVL